MIEQLAQKISTRRFNNNSKGTANLIYKSDLLQHFKNNASDADYQIIVEFETLYGYIFQKSITQPITTEKVLEKEYRKAELRFASEVKKIRIRNYINIFRLPFISFFEYKLKNYKEAIALEIHSLKIASKLEVKEDFYTLHMYRVQQLHNIARIYYAQKKYKEWTQLMNAILLYLFTQENHTIKVRWENGNFENDNKVIYTVMVNQIIQESIKYCDTLKEQKYLAEILKDIELTKPHKDKNIETLRIWCFQKIRFLKNEYSLSIDFKNIELLFLDDAIAIPYKYSLLKSMLPYLSDGEFLNLLNALKNED